MRTLLRSLWAESHVADPPARVWRDWALLAVLLPAAVLEGVLRPDVEWRPVAIVVCCAALSTLLWRRTEPLAMMVLGFVPLPLVGIVSSIAGAQNVELYTAAFVLIIPYAVFRWGTARQAVISLAIMLWGYVVSVVTDPTGVGDAIGGFVVLLFPAVLGADVRYMVSSRAQRREEVKLREREQLARELHDTVAHHVSGIAVQAQAGRAMGVTDPAAALDALAVIEEEASRTLAEMRAMVSALRDGQEPELAPQRGVRDIGRLVDSNLESPRVEVELAGDLDALAPSVDAAVYRLAQESITNATRHARQATKIDVQVHANAENVSLTVTDDGEAAPFGGASSAGYGLVGMAERAKLLGGTLEAGPSPGGGWKVDAVLPRGGAAG